MRLEVLLIYAVFLDLVYAERPEEDDRLYERGGPEDTSQEEVPASEAHYKRLKSKLEDTQKNVAQVTGQGHSIRNVSRLGTELWAHVAKRNKAMSAYIEGLTILGDAQGAVLGRWIEEAQESLKKLDDAIDGEQSSKKADVETDRERMGESAITMEAAKADLKEHEGTSKGTEYLPAKGTRSNNTASKGAEYSSAVDDDCEHEEEDACKISETEEEGQCGYEGDFRKSLCECFRESTSHITSMSRATMECLKVRIQKLVTDTDKRHKGIADRCAGQLLEKTFGEKTHICKSQVRTVAMHMACMKASMPPHEDSKSRKASQFDEKGSIGGVEACYAQLWLA
jgi:hypothetical protein